MNDKTNPKLAFFVIVLLMSIVYAGIATQPVLEEKELFSGGTKDLESITSLRYENQNTQEGQPEIVILTRTSDNKWFMKTYENEQQERLGNTQSISNLISFDLEKGSQSALSSGYTVTTTYNSGGSLEISPLGEWNLYSSSISDPSKSTLISSSSISSTDSSTTANLILPEITIIQLSQQTGINTETGQFVDILTGTPQQQYGATIIDASFIPTIPTILYNYDGSKVKYDPSTEISTVYNYDGSIRKTSTTSNEIWVLIANSGQLSTTPVSPENILELDPISSTESLIDLENSLNNFPEVDMSEILDPDVEDATLEDIIHSINVEEAAQGFEKLTNLQTLGSVPEIEIEFLTAPIGTSITIDGTNFYIDEVNGQKTIMEEVSALSSLNPFSASFWGINKKVTSDNENYLSIMSELNNQGEIPIKPGEVVSTPGTFLSWGDQQYTATSSYINTKTGEIFQYPGPGLQQLFESDGTYSIKTTGSSFTETPIFTSSTGTETVKVFANGGNTYRIEGVGGSYYVGSDEDSTVYESIPWWHLWRLGIDKKVEVGALSNIIIQANQNIAQMWVNPGSSVNPGGLFRHTYTATSSYYDPSAGIVPGSSGQQVYTRDGLNYIRTGGTTFKQIANVVYTPPATIANPNPTSVSVYQSESGWWRNTETWRIGETEYYYSYFGDNLMARGDGINKPVTDQATIDAVALASGRGTLNEDRTVTIEDTGFFGRAWSNFADKVRSGYNQFMYDTRARSSSELAADWNRDGTYRAAMLMLNELLGEYAYDMISGYCTEEWDSSESASGNTPTTFSITDTSVPTTTTAQTLGSVTAEDITLEKCYGTSLTIGTAQYTIANFDPHDYDYSWTIKACKTNNTDYEVYMNPGTYNIASGTISLGDTAAETNSFTANDLYDELCIKVDDTSFGANGVACFPPSSIPINDTPVFNTNCVPMDTFSINNTLEIVFAANKYSSLTEFSTDVDTFQQSLTSTEPFTTYSSNGEINFYQLNQSFNTEDLSEVNNYVNTNCNYINGTPTRLTIVLNNDVVVCSQSGTIVQLNPETTLNTTALSNATIGSVLSDFCSYTIKLNYLNPPVATILTSDISTVPGNITFDFQITDEEYPVTYELLWNFVTLLNGSVDDSSVYQHSLRLPNGDWIIQIKATDKRGQINYSNVLNVLIDDSFLVNFSSISPLTIASGSSVTIDLDSYADDPLGDPIVEWVHDPAFSNCVEFDPIAQITDGQITLKHIGSGSCQETIIFEAIGTNDRKGSDTIIINAG